MNMKTIGNLIWFLFGGLWMGLGWTLVGLVWCISIIGIPVGIQCFKFARLAFFPFGKVIVYGRRSTFPSVQHSVADFRWICPCYFRCYPRTDLLYHHRGNPIWNAVF